MPWTVDEIPRTFCHLFGVAICEQLGGCKLALWTDAVRCAHFVWYTNIPALLWATHLGGAVVMPFMVRDVSSYGGADMIVQGVQGSAPALH